MGEYLPGITVCIASIPPRTRKLRRALGTVVTQTHPATSIVVEVDPGHTGAGPTKNRAVDKATTEWTAILDDDDQMLPHHLEALHTAAQQTGADVVYSMPRIEGGSVSKARFGLPFDADALRAYSYIPTTSLFRTELLHKTDGFVAPQGTNYDDWGCYLQLLDAGASFYHHPEVTWIWNMDGSNTSGNPDRW